MFDNFRLNQLPPVGRLFVGMFAVLAMVIMIWMALSGLMNAGIIGAAVPIDEAIEAVDEAEVEAEIESIMADDEAVTAPDWTDSGQQEAITPEDEEIFEEYAEEDSFWADFYENTTHATEHAVSFGFLFFALGALFVFTGVSAGIKKLFLWLTGILIFLDIIGRSGMGFCWPANFLVYFCGPIILVLFFIMAIIVLRSLGQKG